MAGELPTSAAVVVGPSGSDGPVVRLKVSAAQNATTELVAASAGKKIRVLGLSVSGDAAGTIDLKSATTSLTGAVGVLATSPWTLPFAGCGWCETASGEALNVTTSTNIDLTGLLLYQLVDA